MPILAGVASFCEIDLWEECAAGYSMIPILFVRALLFLLQCLLDEMEIGRSRMYLPKPLVSSVSARSRPSIHEPLASGTVGCSKLFPGPNSSLGNEAHLDIKFRVGDARLENCLNAVVLRALTPPHAPFNTSISSSGSVSLKRANFSDSLDAFLAYSQLIISMYASHHDRYPPKRPTFSANQSRPTGRPSVEA